MFVSLFQNKLKKDVIQLFPLLFRHIDEFSHCTRVYLMKERSKLFPIFISFFNEIKNQFGIGSKILRSDNGKEYFSSSILQQSSPHTPQQKEKIGIWLKLLEPYYSMPMFKLIIGVMQF